MRFSFGFSVGVTLLVSACSLDARTWGEVDGARVSGLVYLVPDIDGDGFADAVRGQGYSPGRPWGFAAPAAIGSSFPFVSASGDFDGDGIVDRVSGSVVELLTDAGLVREAVTLSLPQAVPVQEVVTLPDLDGDGADELIIGLPQFDGPAGADTGAVALYRGGPSGPEALPSLILVGEAAGEGLGTDLAVGDVNGDGLADVVSVGEGAAQPVLSVFPATGTSVSETPSLRHTTDGAILQLAVADLDQDGVSDVITGFSGDLRGYPGVQGTGPVGPATWASLPGSIPALRGLLSLPGTTHPIAAYSDQVAVRLRVGADNTFGYDTYAITGGVNTGLADITGDGRLDWVEGGLVHAGTAQGIGSPVADSVPQLPEQRWVERVDDVDGDGRNDAIIGTQVYLATGVVQTFPEGFVGSLGSLVAGEPPLLAFRHPTAGDHVLPYSTSLLFTSETATTVGFRVVGDIDDDGLRDTVLNDVIFTRPGELSPPTFTSGLMGGAIDAGDVDGDGVDDVVGTFDGFVAVWFGGSTALDPDAPDIRVALPGQVFPAGDLNGDGSADLWVERSHPTGQVFALDAYYGSATGFTQAGVTVPWVKDRRFGSQSWQRHVIHPDGWDRSALLIAGDRSEEDTWILHVTDSGTLAASLYYVSERGSSRGNEAVGLVDFVDDGFEEILVQNNELVRLVDADGDRFFEGTDCDDSDPNAQPVLRWADEDGDGFGDATRPAITCGPTPFTSDQVGDCDDTRADVYPGAPEVCFVDNDCDGLTNESDPDVQTTVWALDADGDGFAGTQQTLITCYDPNDGRLSNAGSDCDDTDASTFPGAAEVCDGVDQDCNGQIDDASEGPEARYRDVDGDGYGTDLLFVCELDERHATQPGDCGPTDATIHPGATEIWYDGIDQDCDGNDTDQDNDGVERGPDCDDTDPSITPVAAEIWYDGIDQNCDGNDDDRDGDGIPFGEDCNDRLPTPCPDQIGAERSACSSLPLSSVPVGLLALVGVLTRRRRSAVAVVALAGCATEPTPSEALHAARTNIPELGPVCDYNGDGILDVVSVQPTASLSAPRGGRVDVTLVQADGSEGPVVVLSGDVPEARLGGAVVCPGDLDGDGTDDLVMGSEVHGPAGAALVFFGSPAGPVTTPQVFPASGARVGHQLYAGDVNGDGLQDVVLQSRDVPHAFTTFFGDGGSFASTPSEIIPPSNPVWATVADVDGDGADDLVGGPFGTGAIVTHAGGEGGLSSVATYTSSAVSSMNRTVTYRSQSDGRDTVVVFGPTQVAVRPERTSGFDLLWPVSTTGASIEDSNQDGYPDLPGSRDTTYWGTAQGPSVLPYFTDTRLPPGAPVGRAVDVDGDGRLDLSLESPPLVVLSSGGTWVPPGKVVGSVGDADADGAPDLAITRIESGSWRWYVAEYAPTITLNPVLGRSGEPDAVLGDLDGNGTRDVLVNGTVVVYLNPPTAPAFWVADGFELYQDAGDLNGDGFDDLVAWSQNDSGVWYGGSAGLSDTPDVPISGLAVPAGDANGDGFADLWVRRSPALQGAHHIFLYLGSAGGLQQTPVDDVVFSDWPRERVPVSTGQGVTRGSTSDVLFGFDGTRITLASLAPDALYTGREGLGVQLAGDDSFGLPMPLSRVVRFVDADGDGSFYGTDCDDDDATVVPRLAWWDADGDGAGDVSRPLMTCTASAVVADNPLDCDETNDAVHPDAPEQCNGVDDNCDGLIDNDPVNPPLFYRDLDGDGVGGTTSVAACTSPATGWVRVGGDCDDSNPARSPGRVETCNGIDDDCNGWVDDSAEGDAQGFLDADGDGFGTTPITACSPDVPWLADVGGDCGPNNADQFPGAPEVWYDGVDQSCDGNDTDQDGDGIPLGADCDDTDASVSPRQPEVWYDGVDQDCDGNDDDQDADGFVEGEDCDDQNPTVFPGAIEIWYDGVDQDCDGNDLDQDGDGLSVITDCDDTDAANVDECDNAPGCATVPAPAGALGLLLVLVGYRRRRGATASGG